jgi:hypothetical protein
VATPYAQPSDVATLLKVTFDAAETTQCEMVLEAVSASMRSRLPDLDAWIAAGLTDPVLAKFCAIAMARQFIDVVDVGNVKSETHPEHTIVFRDITGGEELDVPDSWIDRLTPYDTRTRGGRAFSIRPGSG